MSMFLDHPVPSHVPTPPGPQECPLAVLEQIRYHVILLSSLSLHITIAIVGASHHAPRRHKKQGSGFSK